MKVSTILSLFAFLVIVERSAAIKCYYCVSGQDGCDDAFDSNGSGVEEIDDVDYCMKTKSEANGVQSIARTGTVGSMPKDGCDKVSGGGVTTSTCYCDSDLCNSSAMATGSLVVMVMGVASKFVINSL